MDAHSREYAAAAAGMQETYGDNFAKGDHVTFRLAKWGESSFDSGRVIDHHNGKLLVETDTDIVEVDPRPWPVGNLLPF
jgi:hypothetical protein